MYRPEIIPRKSEQVKDPERAYDEGFIDALKPFAWWQNGEQYVGSHSDPTPLNSFISGRQKREEYVYDAWSGTMQEQVEKAYDQGFRNGLTASAHKVAGELVLGSLRRPLKQQLDNRKKLHAYRPPDYYEG
jgi:hypothetical protein